MGKFDSKKIEKIIHYGFKDKDTLKTAFTHSSYANEKGVSSNERLEFLGDSILSFAIADNLYSNFDVPEGKMSKWRSKMVNTDTLSSIISELKLDDFLLLGKSFGEEKVSKAIKENLFESIVGAIYVDSSLDKAKRFIFRFIEVEANIKQKDVDYKSLLQEEVQKVKGANLVYFTYEVPNNKGTFCAEVYINDIFVARSSAKSKKTAQKECAKMALEDEKTLDKVLGR